MKKIIKIIIIVFFVGIAVLIIKYSLFTNPTILKHGSLVGPNTQETREIFNLVDEIKNTTKIEDCKKYKNNGEYSCVLNVALNNEDFTLCKSLVDIGVVNMCLENYYAVKPRLEVCKEMIFENDPYYERKTECVFDFAVKSKDQSVCSYLSTENLKTECVKKINEIKQ